MKKFIATLIASLTACFCYSLVACAEEPAPTLITANPETSEVVTVDAGEQITNEVIEEIITEEIAEEIIEEASEPAMWPVAVVVITAIIGFALVIIFNLLG